MKVKKNSVWYDATPTKVKVETNWRDVVTAKIKLDTNLLDYSDWVDGLTGNTNDFNVFGTSENNKIINGTIFNDISPIWKTTGVTTLNHGGWVSDYISVDPTKKYRFSVWVKRTNKVYTSLGSRNLLYYGLYVADSNYANQNVIDLPSGAVGTNRYFIFGTYATIDPIFTLDEWFLLSSTIHPYGTSKGGSQETTTGIWNTGGTNLGIIGDRSNYGDKIFYNTNATYLRQRIYHYNYNKGESWEFTYPRIDEVNGLEPSITTLLDNEGMWRFMYTGSV